ncbi:MAG: DNA polymerase III subunit delta' C-terminal domain-containing protein [Clostridiales bacterium]|nr:DNA polymerase III subunit delta' C-terminal domain-containing protein [Clostridiales bacterium]
MYGYTIFHEELMQGLINSVSRGRSSHAYIFHAPEGMFPYEAARLFAEALTCLDKSMIPCGVCRSCVESKANTNPDIITVEAPKSKKNIDVETIRRISEDAAVTPFNAPRKVYIIRNGDSMTPAAQNAFLKTFEEPPEYAVFIIIAKNTDNLLQTIMSRATLITFGALPNDVVEKYIREKYSCSEERLKFLVNYCGGVPGEADDIAENEEFEELRESALKMLVPLLNKNKLDAFKLEAYINENSQNADTIFDLWLSYLRDILIMNCNVFDKCINADKLDKLRSISEVCTGERAAMAAELVCEGKEMLARYVKPGAAVLRLALKLKIK